MSNKFISEFLHHCFTKRLVNSIVALQLIYPVNSYTNVWHKSFCQSRKTSRILEVKKFTFSGIFDWFREKLHESWFHPGDHVSVCFDFSSLLLSSATVLHFCCCCVFTTFNFWWMFIFEVVLLVKKKIWIILSMSLIILATHQS